MQNPTESSASIGMRPPEQVMRLARMGCFHQSRLSFMRALLRDLGRQGWRFECLEWRIDARGVGHALYAAHAPTRTYTLVCFAHELPDALRSDRVIAEQWDATFALYDGVPDADVLQRLRDTVPKQEAGQCRETELVLARANRSVRLFEHVVASLAAGRQPDAEKIHATGYLMRTTAVYANGKFGLSDRERICERAEFVGAFRAELLAVWLIRWFTLHLAEHLARARDAQNAVCMAPALRRSLGVGNATGLGMAPFLILHPALVHSWICARETALLRVRQIEHASPKSAAFFRDLLRRVQIMLRDWQTEDARQAARIVDLKKDVAQIVLQCDEVFAARFAWDQLIRWSQTALSMEGQELLVSLVLEPHAELVDDLADTMAADEAADFALRANLSLNDLRAQLERDYAWALAMDFDDADACARFWYVSEEKLEPRLGERRLEAGADKEQPLAFARDAKALWQSLRAAPRDASLAEFLLRHPRHRHVVRRLQTTARLPYAEVRDNLLAADMLPLDLLRCKLSFFGANRFDPRSDRWVRITMYQHAPLPDELCADNADDWIYPPLPRKASDASLAQSD